MPRSARAQREAGRAPYRCERLDQVLQALRRRAEERRLRPRRRVQLRVRRAPARQRRRAPSRRWRPPRVRRRRRRPRAAASDLPAGPTIHGRPGTHPPTTRGEEFEVLTPMDYGDREAQPEPTPGRPAAAKRMNDLAFAEPRCCGCWRAPAALLVVVALARSCAGDATCAGFDAHRDGARARALRLVGDLAFWLAIVAVAGARAVAVARPTAPTTLPQRAGLDLVVLQDGSASMRVATSRAASGAMPRRDRWQRSMHFLRELGDALSWHDDRLAMADVRAHRGAADSPDARSQHAVLLPRSPLRAAAVPPRRRHDVGHQPRAGASPGACASSRRTRRFTAARANARCS